MEVYSATVHCQAMNTNFKSHQLSEGGPSWYKFWFDCMLPSVSMTLDPKLDLIFRCIPGGSASGRPRGGHIGRKGNVGILTPTEGFTTRYLFKHKTC